MSRLPFPGAYPTTRMRRLRTDGWIRELVAEHRLSASDLIWPIFVVEGDRRQPVESLPGVERHDLASAVEACRRARDLGIPAVAIFPMIDRALRSEDGAEACRAGNLVCRAVSAIKAAVPDLGIVVDVALDPFTSHGHDGVIRDGRILNDETIEILVRQAVVQAEAGADIVAPSDMMDGRIGAIRAGLDGAGRQDVKIMAYSAKYASAFYGPFRDAVGSTGVLVGDKKTYQMDFGNSDEAMREVELDLREGADMVMVKPGLPYLDIIRRVRDGFGVPVLAYQVSGEYAMMKAAAQNGWLNYDKALIEVLTAFRRAGTAGVLTYGAVDAATLLG
ncbi:porphobilinogen synthase [Inquilinus limosus]|uniref:Delta-aminolevulinic acid dehydratase n=1 Tax=Inquilinus limosus MP06 TaxID=1398085 RepID=A0A0A0D4C4_9PROT|nr:porphobilinogen synthase [Inquilinus limosus]KGM33571.1 delta-aminolevulinic acid dehydratase [Inquilinus limosus MP06]